MSARRQATHDPRTCPAEACRGVFAHTSKVPESERCSAAVLYGDARCRLTREARASLCAHHGLAELVASLENVRGEIEDAAETDQAWEDVLVNLDTAQPGPLVPVAPSELDQDTDESYT